MAPVDVDFIVMMYSAVKSALGQGLTAAINVCGIPPPFDIIVAQALKLILHRVGLSTSALALLIAIHAEYYKRNGHFSSGSGYFSTLSNRCSTCGLKGHNSSNHPSTLRSALQRAGISDALEELKSAMESLSE